MLHNSTKKYVLLSPDTFSYDRGLPSFFLAEEATPETDKVANYLGATAQPTVNPLKGWENAPTTVPDTSKVVLGRNNYTYPKVKYEGTAPIVATNEIANETIYPEVSVPTNGSPLYNVYNKTVASENILPVVQAGATSGSEIGVYDSSTPQEALSAHVGTMEPTSEPLLVMNGSELVPVEEMEVLEIKKNPDWVVDIPSAVQPVESNGVEKIRISFIEKNQPLQGVNEVSLQPVPEGNMENIKISFLGNETSPVTAKGNGISLEATPAEKQNQNIKISFETDKEPAVPIEVPVMHETPSHVIVQNLTLTQPSTAQSLPTQAPPMPSGPDVVNPFAGGIVDKIISNATATATPLTPNQNITVDFRHNTGTGVPVTMQQLRK